MLRNICELFGVDVVDASENAQVCAHGILIDADQLGDSPVIDV